MDLSDEVTLAVYRETSTKCTRRILEELRKEVHTAYPRCLLGGYLLDHITWDGFTPPFYKAMTLAWGTRSTPVLVFSEATYQPGYHAAFARPGKPLLRPTGSTVAGRPSPFGQGDHPGYIQGWLERWRQWGAHAEFVGGLWINRIPEENLAENLYHLAKHTRGYWIYDMLSLGAQPRDRLPGSGAPAYWAAIALANRELDLWLRSDGAPVSELRVRPFTLPAPGVSLSLWKGVDLPFVRARPPAPEFMFRRAEQSFHIPAAAGDDVQLTILADSAHPYKKKRDAVAIVVVDPNGQVIRRDKLTIEDLDTKPRPDRRYGGRREVTFRAGKTGTYALFLNGLRYAYTLGASSHPWLAFLRQPQGTRLWCPKKLFVRTLAGAREGEIRFRSGNTTEARISDVGGKVLASQRIGPEGGSITFPLRERAVRVLQVTFRGGAVLGLTGVAGLEPWLAPSKDSPWPSR